MIVALQFEHGSGSALRLRLDQDPLKYNADPQHRSVRVSDRISQFVWKQGVYILNQKPYFSPSSKDYICISSLVIYQNLLLTHPFWLYFGPCCIYFTFSTSTSPLSFLFPHFPSYFLFFSWDPFIFFPRNGIWQPHPCCRHF